MRQVRRFVADGKTLSFGVDCPGHLVRFDSEVLNEWIDLRRSGSVRS